MKTKAQGSLELAIAITCVLLLLLGSLKVFFWMNERFILRQEGYEGSGVISANVNYPMSNQPEVQVDESSFPKLNILGDAE